MRSALQTFIDQNMQDPEGSCYSFVCRGYTGDCVIPKNVCIRFINCDLQGITAEGNNVLNFDVCYFNEGQGGYVFNNGVVNINNCHVRQDLMLYASKFYLSNSPSVTGKITLSTNSYGKSHNNIFSSSESSFVLEKDSKVESYVDSFSNNSKPVFVLDRRSYVKLSEPSFSTTKELCTVNDFSELQIYNLKQFTGNEILAKIYKNSVLKIHTIGNLNIDNTAIILEDSICHLNNVTDVVVKDSFVQATNSTVNLSLTKSVRNTFVNGAYIFKGTNSTFNLYDVDKVLSQSGCFYLENSSLLYVNKDKTPFVEANGGDVVYSTYVGAEIDNTSVVTFNNFDFIKSLNNKIFNLNRTSLRLNRVNSIESKQIAIFSSNKAVITVDDINIMSGEEGVLSLTKGEGKAFLSNIGNIKSAAFATLNVENSALYLKSIEELVSGTNVITATNSICVFSSINKITGTDNGIKIRGSSSLKMENVTRVEGLSSYGIFAEKLDSKTDKGRLDIIMSKNGSVFGSISGISSQYDMYIEGGKVETASSSAIDVNENITVLDNVIINKGLTGNLSIVTLTNVIATGDIRLSDSVITTNYCELENLFLPTTAVCINNRSKYSGRQEIVNSVVNNLLTEINEGVGVRSGVLQNYISSPLQDIVLENSALFNLVSSFSNISMTGRSAYLAAAARVGSPGKISTEMMGPFTNPTGAFIVGSGDFAVAADEKIFIMATDLAVDMQSTTLFNTQTTYDITVGTSTIHIDPSKIELKATSILTKVV